MGASPTTKRGRHDLRRCAVCPRGGTLAGDHVIIYDYVDAGEPALAKMAAKREAGCKALGYEVAAAENVLTLMGTPAELFG
jgi:hypothetical protein